MHRHSIEIVSSCLEVRSSSHLCSLKVCNDDDDDEEEDDDDDDDYDDDGDNGDNGDGDNGYDDDGHHENIELHYSVSSFSHLITNYSSYYHITSSYHIIHHIIISHHHILPSHRRHLCKCIFPGGVLVRLPES